MDKILFSWRPLRLGGSIASFFSRLVNGFGKTLLIHRLAL